MASSWQDDPSDYLKSAIGGPVTITSGFRTPQHNALVGGVPNSDHLRGQAYDFVPQDMSMADAAARLKQSGVPATKILNEGNHIHVSYPAQGQMAVSDDDILKSFVSGSAPKSPASSGAGSSPAAHMSDDQIISSWAKSIAAPAATQAAFSQPTVPKTTNGLPKRFEDSVGLAGSMNVPFLKDTLAGFAGLEDVAGNALSGHGDTSLGNAYQTRMSELNQKQADFEKSHPLAQKYGWVLGILAGGEAAAGADTTKAGVNTLGQLMKSGAKTGAIAGTAYGAGTSGDDNSLLSRVKNAGIGTVTGVLTGGVGLPILGKTASIGGQAIGKIAKSLSEKLGITLHDATKEAENMLMTAFSRDNVDPAAVTGQLANSGGKPLTPMDVAGTNTQRLARKLVTQPGEAGDKITAFLGNRADDQSGRVLGDITNHLSSNTDVYGLADKLTQDRSTASKPLWDKAMNAAPATTDRLAEFAGDPDVKAGISEGIKLARREALANGEKFDPNAYAITGFDAAGDPKIGGVPTWRTWQAAKEGLDAKIETFRNEVTGQLPNTKSVNSLVNLKNSLLKELDSVNPDYKAAREAWAGPSGAKTAMSMGESAFKADPEEISKAFNRMSDSEKDFYRVGAARALQDKANSAVDSADLSKRLYGNTRLRTQIETVFGKGSADAFGQAMGQEGKMSATNRFVLGGSNTANKFADLADHGTMVAEDMVHGAMAGGPKGMVLNPAMGAIRRGVGSLFAMNPATAAGLSDILTKSGHDAVPTLNRLMEVQAKRAGRNALVGRAASGANSLAAAVAAQRAATQRRSSQ